MGRIIAYDEEILDTKQHLRWYIQKTPDKSNPLKSHFLHNSDQISQRN